MVLRTYTFWVKRRNSKGKVTLLPRVFPQKAHNFLLIDAKLVVAVFMFRYWVGLRDLKHKIKHKGINMCFISPGKTANRCEYLSCVFTLSHRIPPNVRDIVYCTGVSLMDEDVWEFIWMKFHSSTAISEKRVLLEALTCSDNIFLLNRSVDILKLLKKIKMTHTLINQS